MQWNNRSDTQTHTNLTSCLIQPGRMKRNNHCDSVEHNHYYQPFIHNWDMNTAFVCISFSLSRPPKVLYWHLFHIGVVFFVFGFIFLFFPAQFTFFSSWTFTAINDSFLKIISFSVLWSFVMFPLVIYLNFNLIYFIQSYFLFNYCAVGPHSNATTCNGSHDTRHGDKKTETQSCIEISPTTAYFAL